MRKSNVDVGTVVELKDCSTKLCSDSDKKGYDQEVFSFLPRNP